MAKILDELAEIRQQLDTVDRAIQDLLNQRAALSIQIGQIKQNQPLPENETVVYYRPEREAQILREIEQRNAGPLETAIVVQIFRTLMSACLALQQQLKVAYLGPPGTFSQEAALKHFGPSVALVAADTIAQALHQVETGAAHFAVVPIENSLAGVVESTLTALSETPQQICGEVILPIYQHLWRAPGATQAIKKIYGHAQSLAQCQKWLALHADKAEKIAVSSNSVATQLAQTDPSAAAVAGDNAGTLYGLTKLAAHIEDQSHNQTRFWVVGKQQTPPSGCDKTTLLIKSPHTPGALLQLLQPFADNQVNITWLESRPYPYQSWRYLFFLDIEGHQTEQAVKQALQTLTQQTSALTVLGSYPKFCA